MNIMVAMTFFTPCYAAPKEGTVGVIVDSEKETHLASDVIFRMKNDIIEDIRFP